MSVKVFEKDRFISSFGRELHNMVTNTEPHSWRDSVKALYRAYAKKGAVDTADGDDDEQVKKCTTITVNFMEPWTMKPYGLRPPPVRVCIHHLRDSSSSGNAYKSKR